MNLPNNIIKFTHTATNRTGSAKFHYLNKNPIRLRHRFEEIIRRPTNSNQRIPQLRRRHQVAELNDTPRQKRGGESHRKTELDIIAGVVVAAGEVSLVSPAIAEAGVGTPRHPLILRQESRSLAFEEQDTFRQGVAVIVAGKCKVRRE